jgi:hypothetical protein
MVSAHDQAMNATPGNKTLFASKTEDSSFFEKKPAEKLFSPALVRRSEP